jgi:hypothetical protein
VRRLLAFILAAAVAAGCTGEPSPTTSPPPGAGADPATTGTADITTSTAVAGAASPGEGTETAVVAACEAEDQPIVAASVVPLGGEMAVGEDTLWISSLAAGGVVPVDAATLCPADPVVLENGAFGVAAATFGEDGTVYLAAARSGALSAIDPVTRQATALAPGVDGGGGLAVSDGLLWAVCCDTDRPQGGGVVIDLESGETVAEILIGPAIDIDVVGDTAWIGRRGEAGMYRVTLMSTEVEVEELDATGSDTQAVAASEEGVWMLSDEPILQRFVSGRIQEVTTVPFPRDRGADLDVDDEGGVWAVSAFGPGIIWLRPDGVAFNALGADNLVQVEATPERVWALTTDGALIRIDRSVLVDG